MRRKPGSRVRKAHPEIEEHVAKSCLKIQKTRGGKLTQKSKKTWQKPDSEIEENAAETWSKKGKKMCSKIGAILHS